MNGGKKNNAKQVGLTGAREEQMLGQQRKITQGGQGKRQSEIQRVDLRNKYNKTGVTYLKQSIMDHTCLPVLLQC